MTNDNENSSSDVLDNLRRKAQFAEGWLYGILFAKFSKEAIEYIEAEIRAIEEVPNHLTANMRAISAEHTTTLGFRKGYREGLVHALQLIKDGESSIAQLHHDQFEDHGRSDALNFALKHRGEVTTLRTELERVQTLVARGAAKRPQGPMSPGASPRIYRDGYIIGLNEALELITFSPEN